MTQQAEKETPADKPARATKRRKTARAEGPPKFYVNVSGDPQALASGQVLAPGADSKRVNPKDPHDKRLIQSGAIIEKETS